MHSTISLSIFVLSIEKDNDIKEEKLEHHFIINKIKFGMGKKYLLTFSLAAISCLATKTIQNVLAVSENENQVEIANNESLPTEPQVQLVLDFGSNIY